MMKIDRGTFRALALACTLLASLSAASQSLTALGFTPSPDVDIEKLTEGQNADAAPGPTLTVGSTVNWTYVVTNIGSRPLTNIVVTDDQGVVVTCPATTLGAGLSFTCTASGTVIAGQYENLGSVSATLPDMTVVQDIDLSHYFGQAAPSVTIEKRTNGLDADTAPGPSVPVGSTVNWEYEVTNIGTEDLDNILVTDDHFVSITCPGTTLTVGTSMICTASATALAGQYSNIGSVTAHLTVSDTATAASDPSHYFGQTLGLVKKTNGVESAGPPGPTVIPGSTVNWTYAVTNPGPETVTGLTVTDDQGVSVTCPQTTIVAGGTVTCTGSGPAQAGLYTNIGTAQATLPLGGTVTASDAGFYFGNPLGIQKLTNGIDADLAPGPAVVIGSTVNWTYVVTNLGSETFTGVGVTDNQGVTVTCPQTTLNGGESMTCTASDVAAAGQYANIGTVDATSPTLGAISASDPSHYFGQDTLLDFGDAPDPTFQTLLASNGARHVLGGSVFLGACVDAEADGLQSAAADGDDNDTGTEFGTCATPGDDEDGVTFTTPVRVGLSSNIDVVASAPCKLSAWIDFTGDGDWGDPGEDLFPGGTDLLAGANSLSFTVPASATPGPSFARFRCTTDGAVGFVGEASDGEVEDYAVNIVIPVPNVSATKDDALQVDVDSDTLPDPGDTLRYTVVITNNGTGDATGVVFNDTPGANTSLVVGSVTTSAGSVTTGNTAGNTSVAVNVGTIPALGGSATITFDAVIGNPLPLGVSTVSNQGVVSGGNFAGINTDDPNVGGATDPTVTILSVPPAVTATKNDTLFVDVDNDSIADPGDTLLYTIVITNSGTGAATGVILNDTPDANTALVVGSVTTTAGSVTTGNTGGDTAVSVNIGTIAGLGGTATVTFKVVIDNPFPPGPSIVSNQGTASGTNFSVVATDDPAVGGSSDPTITNITVTPVVTATKTAALFVDVDNDTLADPGDTLRYTITVTNSGTGAALAVQFNDRPDANTSLVAGSVTTSAGTVTTGNTAGDTSVTVDIGTLAAPGVVTITFDVQIHDPLPVGVTKVVNSGTVSGSNFPSSATDDPSVPGSNNPTVFVVAAVPIPTLEWWALLALVAMLGLVALRRQ